MKRLIDNGILLLIINKQKMNRIEFKNKKRKENFWIENKNRKKG